MKPVRTNQSKQRRALESKRAAAALRRWALASVVLAPLVLSSCGQMGPLYQPLPLPQQEPQQEPDQEPTPSGQRK